MVWWMSGVVDVWCGGCPILHMVWWMSGVVDVWCGGCLILHTVWWMSGVVDVCVVDVVQSLKIGISWQIFIILRFSFFKESFIGKKEKETNCDSDHPPPQRDQIDQINL